MLQDLLVQDYPLVFKDSVVILEGIPFYILEFNKAKAECLNIYTQDYVHIDFKKVKSIRVPNAGYMNYRGVACYVMRYPARKFKHGLSRDNTSILNHHAKTAQSRMLVRECFDKANTFQCKSHYDMYMKLYPSLNTAIKRINEGAFFVAFDRQFAINDTFDLYYKTERVGIINGRKPVFLPEYSHLSIAYPKE